MYTTYSQLAKYLNIFPLSLYLYKIDEKRVAVKDAKKDAKKAKAAYKQSHSAKDKQCEIDVFLISLCTNKSGL